MNSIENSKKMMYFMFHLFNNSIFCQENVSIKLRQGQQETGKVGECKKKTLIQNIPQVNRLIGNT